MKNVVNRTHVWVKKNVIYYLKSIMQRKGFESRDGEWTEGEASIQHPFSIHSASIGHPLRAGGKQVASSYLAGVWKYAAMLLIFLTLGAGEMWGASIFNCGIDVNGTWYKGTGTINSGNWLEGKTAFNSANLGTLTEMELGGQYDTWDNNQTDYCSWNGNNGIWITIKKGSTQKANFKLSCYHDSFSSNNNTWKTKGGTGGCSDSGSWNTYTYDISGYAPGSDYTIKASWTSPSSQSTEATASFTIPGFSTSSASKAFSSIVAGNTNSATISFTQHYGTALATSNCSLSGTNASEFSVTSISETGVTVQFAPTSAGSKSATLTITDAHSKTCTITLSGSATTANYTVTYAVGTSYTSYGSISAAKTVGGDAVSSGASIVSGTGITFTATPNTGYEVAGFYSNAACSTSLQSGSNTTYATTIGANTSVYVKFVKSTYTISYTAAATGWSYGTKPTTGQYGDSKSFVVTPATGYTVTVSAKDAGNNTVSLTKSSNTYTFTQPASNVSVTVSATEKKSTITVTTATTSQGTLKFGSTSKTWGTTTSVGVTTSTSITATAASGFKFVRWDLSGAATSSNTLTNTTISLKANGTGNTGTATAVFEEDLSTVWYLTGTMNDWSTTANKFTKNTGESTGSVAYTTVSLTANTTYQFGVNNGSDYYANNNGSSEDYYIKGTVENWTFNKDLGYGVNCYMKSSLAGTYTFKIDFSASNPKISVYYPAVYAISGGFNSWTETTNLAFTGNDGTYSVSINGSSTNYEFKVLDNGVWYGHNNKTFTATESNVTLSSPNNNIKLKADVYPSGTYTFAYNKSTHKLGVTYPTSYVVTFGKRTGGNTVTAKINNTTAFSSGTKIAPNTSVTFSQTAAAGYTFEGWYSASTGGTKLSSSATYTVSITAAKTVYANYTPNQYTVHFNNNGGTGATPGDITVTYGAAYGTLPAGPTPPGVDQFAGWYTAQTGGTRVTAETLVSKASEHTLWARFESTFTVTVQYKCGDDVLRPQITTHASETSVAATIIAPNIVGYAFVNWTGSNATFADATNDTTTVNVTSATTIVANYTAVPMVCFKNNLDWDDVYVTFDCYWKDWGGQQVVGNKEKPYYKMTQLGQTDIYYCVIPSEYTDNNYANWKGNIAFDNKGFGDYTTTHLGTYDPFWKGEFLGRADFDPNATMYIPYNGDKETRNEGTYYPTGCWLQYNTTYSGYKVNIWDAVNGNSGTQLNYPGTELRAETAGGFEFKASVYLSNSASARGVKLYKDKTKNSNEIWYTNVNNEANTITSATTTLPWSFVGAGSDENWQRCRILPEVSGDYIFTVSFATGRPMVNIEYPVTTGDFRLVYKDRATWNNEHSASWKQISPVFKHKANRVDTASFFISYGSSPTLALEKCTKIEGGVETWTKQGSNIPLSSISSKGVYNFTVTQNSTGSSATAAYLGAYTGNYYIRTDASDGGWGSYSKGSNNLTYSEYSLTHGGDFGPYSHYFMRHVDNGQNIKFIIANDYNPCLTDTLVNDTIVNEWISSEANVRFMWHNGSNKIGRAYISGSSIVSDRFLVLEGDTHLYDENGNSLTGTHKISDLNDHEMKFFDDQNWIYETTVQANPLERVKLTAKFNNKVQYFYGAPGTRTDATTHQLIGGSGSGKYKMRVVYDFKTNRLLAAWLPDGDITTEFTIDADVMIIRYHQQDAQQITFTSGSKLKEVKTVYGAMKFNKYRLNNQSEESGHADLGISQYERDLFFISFPFDVKLNDVFGFGNYGKHWIIEYYDGKGRAEKGFWADSPTNWKFVTTDMKDSYTLKANEGYVLALDLDKLTLESSVWNYGVENVYLYFPSTANVDDIEATSRTITIDQTGYQCTIDRRTNKNVPDVNKDRRVADSYWHLIGVPSYANASNSTSSTWTGTVPDLDPANWTTKAPFVYDWNASTNKCGVISTTSSTFKPMRAYLTQYAKTTIVWSSVNATPQSVAARRSTQHVSNYEFRLELQYDGKEEDRTFVSLREDEEVTNDFDFSFDLCKELYGSFTPISQIYTIAGEGIPAAGNCLPLETEKETSVPVGVVTKVAGAYTFAMPDGTEGLSVTLVDNVTGTHTNLALGDYTVELEAGTYDNRFMLVIDPRTTTTSVETVGAEGKDAPRKVFINGLMYIQRGNALYDTTGRKVE